MLRKRRREMGVAGSINFQGLTIRCQSIYLNSHSQFVKHVVKKLREIASLLRVLSYFLRS